MISPSLPTGPALLPGGSTCGADDLSHCSVQTLRYFGASKLMLGWSHLVGKGQPYSGKEHSSLRGEQDQRP